MSWKPMEHHGSPWNLMEPYRTLGTLLVAYQCLQMMTYTVRGQAEDSRKARVNHDEFDEELSEQEGRLAL
jgi:hypothetical protein